MTIANELKRVWKEMVVTYF